MKSTLHNTSYYEFDKNPNEDTKIELAINNKDIKMNKLMNIPFSSNETNRRNDTNNNTSNLIEEMTPADTQTMNTNYNNYKDTFDTLYNETLNQLFVWNQKTNQLLLINSPSNSSDSYNADSDNLTNDRKTFYESQRTNSLNIWNNVFTWIYIFIIIAYILGMFIDKSTQSMIIKGLVLFVMVIYPFLINVVLYSSYAYIINQLYGGPMQTNIPSIHSAFDSKLNTYLSDPTTIVYSVLYFIVLIVISYVLSVLYRKFF